MVLRWDQDCIQGPDPKKERKKREIRISQGFSLLEASHRGGYTSCRFLVMKNARIFSKHLGPKRSLNAHLRPF